MAKTQWVLFENLNGSEEKWITRNKYHVGDKILSGICHMIEVTDFSIIYYFKEEQNVQRT